MKFTDIISLVSDICSILSFIVSICAVGYIKNINKSIKKSKSMKGKAKDNGTVFQAGRDINNLEKRD